MVTTAIIAATDYVKTAKNQQVKTATTSLRLDKFGLEIIT